MLSDTGSNYSMKPTEGIGTNRQYLCLVTRLSITIGLQGVNKMSQNVLFSQPQKRNIRRLRHYR